MVSVIWLTGALVTVFGAYILLDTSRLHNIVDWALTEKRLLRISLLRFLLAIAFYMGAEQTRAPTISLILAGLFLISALVIPVMGKKPVRKLAGWWLSKGAGLQLPYAILAIIFGTYLMWLAWPA